MSEEREFHVGPSRIVLFDRCPRKYYFEYVMGLRRESTASQAKGTAYHKEIEEYLLEGKKPSTTIVQAAVEMLPPYSHNILVESWLNVPMEGGVICKQKADIVDLTNPEEPHILDIKTMKNFKYALHSFQLKENIQLLCYAAAVIELYAPKAKRVKVSHLQIPTEIVEFPRIESSYLEVAELLTKYSQLQQKYVNRMRVVNNAASPGDVEKNLNACGDYGGCPHTTICESADINNEEVRTFELEKKTMETAFVLYIDCLPKNETVTYFADFAAPLLEMICKETKALDYRLVEYGKGKGYLAAFLKKAPLPTSLYISTRDDMSSISIETLTPRATLVIQGTR